MKRFDDEYKKYIESHTPDLWDRIEERLPKKAIVTPVNSTEPETTEVEIIKSETTKSETVKPKDKEKGHPQETESPDLWEKIEKALPEKEPHTSDPDRKIVPFSDNDKDKAKRRRFIRSFVSVAAGICILLTAAVTLQMGRTASMKIENAEMVAYSETPEGALTDSAPEINSTVPENISENINDTALDSNKYDIEMAEEASDELAEEAEPDADASVGENAMESAATVPKEENAAKPAAAAPIEEYAAESVEEMMSDYAMPLYEEEASYLAMEPEDAVANAADEEESGYFASESEAVGANAAAEEESEYLAPESEAVGANASAEEESDYFAAASEAVGATASAEEESGYFAAEPEKAGAIAAAAEERSEDFAADAAKEASSTAAFMAESAQEMAAPPAEAAASDSSAPAEPLRADQRIDLDLFVNSYSYNLPAPSEEELFTATAVLGECPWNIERKLAVIFIKAGTAMDTLEITPEFNDNAVGEYHCLNSEWGTVQTAAGTIKKLMVPAAEQVFLFELAPEETGSTPESYGTINIKVADQQLALDLQTDNIETDKDDNYYLAAGTAEYALAINDAKNTEATLENAYETLSKVKEPEEQLIKLKDLLERKISDEAEK